MISKREVKEIPYAGYTVDSYVLIDEHGNYIIPACDFLLDIAIKGSPLNTIKAYASDLVSFYSQLSSCNNIERLFPSNFTEISGVNLESYLIGLLFQ
jgi:hypothetical protein